MPLTTAALTATAAILVNVLIIAILLDRDVDTTDGRKATASIPRFRDTQHPGRDPPAVAAGFARVVERFGGVDVVFANAGVQDFASLPEMSDELWHDQIDINLTGTANVLRVAAPLHFQPWTSGGTTSPSTPSSPAWSTRR